VAVFLNFSPDHLDRHTSVEEYAAAKARLFTNQTAGDLAIVNADDPTVVALAARTRARVVRLSETGAAPPSVVVERDAIVWNGEDGCRRRLVPLGSIRLLGPHLRLDVAAAAAVATSAGVDAGAIERAVAGFTGLEHALEPVTTIDGVQFVNDSKATNVEAARRAIESFGEGLVAIVGGRFKGGDLGALAEPLAARHATVVAIGESASLVADALSDRVPVLRAGSMAEAVARAFAAAAPGGVVVLAPACASFDWFHDYAERGRVFKEEVRRLAVSRVAREQ
jgi:UDP-N-acetylmuramoylalanine--D-glutamate ligase